jgi:biopolymer transport protein ExbB
MMMSKRYLMTLMFAAVFLVGILGRAFAQDEKAAAAPAAAQPAAGLEVKGEAAKPASDHDGMNFVTIVFRAGWFGVAIWLMLIAASIVSVALTVDSFLSIREKRISPPPLVEKVRAAMEQGDVMKAIKHCEEEPCPLSNILLAGFSNVKEGFEVIQDSISVAADLESEKMLQRVTYLSVISNTTPMLGLIGTVQGMIMAFYTLGTQAAGAAQQAMLALNISHGLWATAVGLGTAVPATIFFYFFKNKAMRLILTMEALTLDLVKALRNVEVVEE